MSSHSFKSTNQLIQSVIKNSKKFDKSSSSLNNEIVREALVEIHGDKIKNSVRYAYCKDNSIIICTHSSGWATKLRLQKRELIDSFNDKNQKAPPTSNRQLIFISELKIKVIPN